MRLHSIRWTQLFVAALLACPVPLPAAETPAADPGLTYRQVVEASRPFKENPKDTIDWERFGGAKADQPIPGPVTQAMVSASPVFTQREWPGEAMGMNGPLIVEGTLGKQKGLGVYAPGGQPLYFGTMKEIKADPSRFQQALRDAFALGGGLAPERTGISDADLHGLPDAPAVPKGGASGVTKDADGNTVTYVKQPGGSTTKTVTSPDGKQLSKETVEPPAPTKPAAPPKSGELGSMKDQNGNTVTIKKDPETGGKVRVVTAPDGRTISEDPIVNLPSKPKQAHAPEPNSLTDEHGNTVTVGKLPDGTRVRITTAPDGTVLNTEPVDPPRSVPKPVSDEPTATWIGDDGLRHELTLNPDGTRTHVVRDPDSGLPLAADPVGPVTKPQRQAHHVHGSENPPVRQAHHVHGTATSVAAGSPKDVQQANPPAAPPPPATAVTNTPQESILDDLAPNPVAPQHAQPKGDPTCHTAGDGTLVRTFPDGTTEYTHPDGGQFIRFADDHTYQRHPDGTAVDRKPDGSETHRDAAGNVVRQTGPTVKVLRVPESEPVIRKPKDPETQAQPTPQQQPQTTPQSTGGSQQSSNLVGDREFQAWTNTLDPLQRQTLDNYLTPRGKDLVADGAPATPAQPTPNFNIQGTYVFRGFLTHDPAKAKDPDPDHDGAWNIGTGVQYWDFAKDKLSLGADLQYQYLGAYLHDKPSAVGKTPTIETGTARATGNDSQTPFGTYDFDRINRTWGMGLYGQGGMRQDFGLLGDDDPREDTVNKLGFTDRVGSTYVTPLFEFQPSIKMGRYEPYLVAPLYRTGQDSAMLLHPSGHLSQGQLAIDPKALEKVDWSKIGVGGSYTPRWLDFNYTPTTQDLKTMDGLLNESGWVDRDKDGVREACPAVSGQPTRQDFGRFALGLDPALRDALNGYLNADGKKATDQAARDGFAINDDWQIGQAWRHNLLYNNKGGGMTQIDPPGIALDLPAGSPPAALDYGMGSTWGLGLGYKHQFTPNLSAEYMPSPPIESVLGDLGPSTYEKTRPAWDANVPPDTSGQYQGHAVGTGGLYGGKPFGGKSEGPIRPSFGKGEVRLRTYQLLPNYQYQAVKPLTHGGDSRPRFGSHYYGKWEEEDYYIARDYYEDGGKGYPIASTYEGVTFMEPPSLWQPNTIHIWQYGAPDHEGYRDIAHVVMTIENGQWVANVTYYVEDLLEGDTWNAPPNDPLYFKGEAAAKQAERKAKAERRPKPDMSLAAPLGMEGENPAILKKKEPVITAVDQWGLRAVGYTPEKDSAWKLAGGEKPNTVVAVIDSGLDMDHPDAPAHLWTNEDEVPGNGVDDDRNGYADDVHGWNFVDDSSDLSDRRGHGTLVAGIIAAKRNNGIGIAGINPGARIMVLKVTTDTAAPNNLAVYRAIRYAADQGARVINLSLGGVGRSRLIQLAVNYAHLRGAVVVAASGNANADTSAYWPAGLRRVLAVGAMTADGARQALSNYGPNTSLLAPGEDIYSLHSSDAEWPGPSTQRDREYRAATGTSFAAPIVSATASLLFAQDAKRNNREVEALLLATAKDLDRPGWDPATGYGVLDATAALQMDVTQAVVALPTEVVVRRQGKKVEAVEVYGVAAGAGYELSLGEGRNPSEWTTIARSARPVRFGLLGRVDKAALKGGKEWTVRITVTGKDGSRRSADVPITL